MIDRVVRAIAAAAPGCSAEAIADALWLATLAARQDPEPDVALPAAADPRPPDRDTTPAAPVPPPRAEPPPGPPAGDLVETGPAETAAAGVPAIAVGLTAAADRRQQIPAAYALAPFRRVHRPGPPVVDIDATVDATADAGSLTVVTRPGRERGLDVAIVVEDSPVAAAWAEAIADFEGVVRRAGAFRQVTRWTLHWEPAPVLRDANGADHGPLRLTDPTGRRLILVVTDATADPWYAPEIWTLLQRWAQLMPVAVLNLLPARYWGFTAVGSPTVALRARRPGAVNATADVLRAWWSGDDTGPVAVPVVALQPADVRRWAHAMAAGTGWIDAVWAGPPDARPGGETNAGLSAADRVRAFQARATPHAQTLARILAGAPVLSLPLLQILQRELLPAAGPAELAEILVSGLLERLPAAPTGPQSRLRWRPGIAELLARGTSASQDWSVYEVLSAHLQRWAGSGQSIEALLAHPLGPYTVDPDLEPFALMSRRLAQRLGIDAPPSPADGADRPANGAARTATVLCVDGSSSWYWSLGRGVEAWHAAMADGLARAVDDPQQVPLRFPDNVEVIDFADLFGGGPPPTSATEMGNLERAVLLGWLSASGADDTAARTQSWSKVRATVLRTLNWTTQGKTLVSRSGSPLAELMVRYLTDPDVRTAVQQRIAAAITPNIKVIVASSVGAIAVYEALSAHPELTIQALITLGAPLGDPVVLPRLQPPPGHPLTNVGFWTNIAAQGDLVAHVDQLPRGLVDRWQNVFVDNGDQPHGALRYLGQPETGAAILAGLTGQRPVGAPRFDNLAASCVVLVHAAGLTGSGFFVAPGVVVTSAHLVRGGDDVQVRWRDEQFTATVRWAPDETSPDLAVLDVELAPRRHPTLRLADRTPALGASLITVGFTQVSGGPELQAAHLAYQGSSGGFLRLLGEVRPGMSGAPMIDPQTGAVLAVVNSTNQLESAVHAVPIGALRQMPVQEYQRLLRAHDLHHRNDPDPAASEERELLALLAEHPAAPQVEHHRAFERATGGAVREPELPLNDYRDVVAELGELMTPAGEVPPVLGYVASLARTSESLRTWLMRAATERGLDTELLAQMSAPTRTSLIISVEPAVRAPDRYRSTIWFHHEASAISQFTSFEVAAGIEEIGRQLRRSIADAIHATEPDRHLDLLEFVVPDTLMDVDFENWREPGRSRPEFGRSHAVAVRSLDRFRDVEMLTSSWRRWEAIGSKAAITPRAMPCRFDDQRLESLIEDLELDDGDVPVFGSSPVSTDAFATMIYSGVPVMAWRRGACAGTPDGDHEQCQGQLSAAEICRALQGAHRDDLPERVRHHRMVAASMLTPDEHVGRDLVLLWDDPGRRLDPLPLS
ncbi:SAV_2336 N-terminal domain-related protein [Dactylosporangium siamense]|uniref:Trypsin-like peptidase domain-containing protein n=1 Tax=Dactylosporangium siamense TaxID=685454 RepID=A0A919PFG7_9ACTN|nr:SAV_2336 N-terminal domain-related protein [Dactylosporangium siamense]GIG43860.1 hypothetical protein Dsi01nite_019010 [Dactylosporangium siamense]